MRDEKINEKSKEPGLPSQVRATFPKSFVAFDPDIFLST
jgi:hypothetical protein